MNAAVFVRLNDNCRSSGLLSIIHVFIPASVRRDTVSDSCTLAKGKKKTPFYGCGWNEKIPEDEILKLRANGDVHVWREGAKGLINL